jgi:hypothetical protein
MTLTPPTVMHRDPDHATGGYDVEVDRRRGTQTGLHGGEHQVIGGLTAHEADHRNGPAGLAKCETPDVEESDEPSDRRILVCSRLVA